MREEFNYKDFIGIYDNFLNNDIIKKCVYDFNIAKQFGLVSNTDDNHDMSVKKFREDSSIFLQEYTFLHSLERKTYLQYINSLRKMVNLYTYNYKIEEPWHIPMIKIHNVLPSQGYHLFHKERQQGDMQRLLVFLTYIEVPESGGETEFLFQGLRVEPKVGRTLIWPAEFTHYHRGNPPLSGNKMYITGWVDYVSG